MHDDDRPMSRYEDELRHALQRMPAPETDTDDVLARVEVGVRRRVRRRRIGSASLGVAAVLTAAVVVVPSFYDGSSDDVADPPSGPTTNKPTGAKKQGKQAAGTQKRGTFKTPKKRAKQAPAGKPTEPNGLSVSAVATNRRGDVSVIGKSTCPDGPCVVTGSPKQGSRYRIAPSGDRLHSMNLTKSKTVNTDEPGIQVGTDPSNSWAWTDAFYATHNAGKSWKRVRLPASLTVDAVQPNNGRVWAFGSRADGRPAVAASPEHADDWSTVPVPVRRREAIATPMIVGKRLAFVASDRRSERAELVRQRPDGWDRQTISCPRPVNSTSTRGTVWLGCRTSDGSDYVTWSHDGGATWDAQGVDEPGLDAVGGIDGRSAVAAAGDDLIVVGSDGSTEHATTPYDRSDDVWDGEPAYDSVRINRNGTGFATTNGGALARTDDGGRTWQAQDLP